MDVASSLTRSGMVNVPLGFSSYILLGEVSIITHAIGLVLIIVVFLRLGEPPAEPLGA